MIKPILSAAALSFALVSAAWALPATPKTDLPALNQTDVIQVGKKGHGGHGHNYKHYGYKGHYRGRYHHGGRYWGHRYSYRPYGWQTLGCVAVGPVWYCP
jgi:hypothetical protein